MRRALVAILLLVAGCASSAMKSAKWQSTPTPEMWRPGQTWAFIVLDQKRNLRGSITLRFTDQPANRTDSCVGGEWKKVEVLGFHSAGNAYFIGSSTLVYSLKGSALEIGSYSLCDAYSTLYGELTDFGVSGTYSRDSMFSHETLGLFYGVEVQP
jgi:hypothetical protein